MRGHGNGHVTFKKVNRDILGGQKCLTYSSFLNQYSNRVKKRWHNYQKRLCELVHSLDKRIYSIGQNTWHSPHKVG